MIIHNQSTLIHIDDIYEIKRHEENIYVLDTVICVKNIVIHEAVQCWTSTPDTKKHYDYCK